MNLGVCKLSAVCEGENKMLMAEVIPHYAAPLTGVTEYFNDHRKNIDYDVLNLHNPEESNNILQQCDQAVSFTTVSLENETQKFISKRERKHMYDFLQNKKNVDVDILYCRAIEEEDKKRHLLEEYRRLYGERKKDKEETSLSMSVPYYDKHNQISLAENPTQHNPDPAHTHHHTQTQHKHLPQDTYECKCATSGENGRRISLSLIVPCCGKDHHIDLALDCSGRGCQVTGNEGAVRHEQEESASKGSSQKKTSSFTLSVPLSEGHHLQVKTLTSSSHEATATQEISISSDSDPHICSLKKQNLKTGTKELQHCEQMSTFEMHSNVESLEKKQKTNIVKKLLHHKYKVCSPVVRRYEADRGVSCLEETFTKDCALGQKKNRDFNSWKKKIRRICHGQYRKNVFYTVSVPSEYTSKNVKDCNVILEICIFSVPVLACVMTGSCMEGTSVEGWEPHSMQAIIHTTLERNFILFDSRISQ